MHPFSFRLSFAALILTTSCIAVGCGDDTEYSGENTIPAIVSEEDRSTKLTEVTDTQWEEICSNFAEGISAQLSSREFCEGIIVATIGTNPEQVSSALCEEGVSECIETDPLSDINCNDNIASSCTATLDEWDTCLRAQLASISAAIKPLSCEDLGSVNAQSAGQTLDDIDQIPACKPLLDTCPSALGYCNPADNPNCECYDNNTGSSCEFAGYNDPVCQCFAFEPECGDGFCEGDEETTCAQDCDTSSFCGDNRCTSGEDSSSCPQDCNITTACGDGVCNESEDSSSCPQDCGEKYRFVLIEDDSFGGGGDSPGADIDAVSIVRPDGSILFATTVEDFSIGSSGSFPDPTQALGAPDSNCEARNFVALGGSEAGGFMILGFASASDEGEFRRGDSIVVSEIGSTMCPNSTFDDDPYSISISIATNINTFTEIASDVQGNSPIVVP